ncbi:type IX secretion system protein PorD [Rufibacter soli]
MSAKKIGWVLLGLLFPLCSMAQELRCEVIVNSDQIQATDRQVFQQMQNAISEVMNNTRWTSDVYQNEERIRCKLFITLRAMPQVGVFEANTQVISSRPTYGTGYETTVLSFVDTKFEFDYTQAQPLQYAPNTFTTNLTAILSFYAYTIIGMDNDSFSRMGGANALAEARNILNLVTSSGGAGGGGWSATADTRNRYWLINNLVDPQFEPYRAALYLYHRQGLDLMARDPEKGRQNILEALRNIQQVARLRPGAAVLRSFFEAKSAELSNAFTTATPAQKQQAYELLSQVDPTNRARYETLLQR